MAGTTEEKGGDTSGRRAGGWRRRTPAADRPTPPTMVTRSRAAQSASPPAPPSQQRKRKRTGTPQEREIAGPTGREDEGNAEKEAAPAVSASPAAAEHAPSSSDVSSPLRWPSLPRAVIGKTAFGDTIYEPFHKIDQAIVSAHEKLQSKYHAKRDRQLKLASLDDSVPRSCLVDSRLMHSRESATKIVLQIAKVVLGLSSYIDGKLLRHCSGFVIEWDAESKIGIILTSALVIQSKSPSADEWLARDEYAPHAKVCVHLLDKAGTVVVADLVNYDKHYNLALFKIVVDLSTQIPYFTSEVKCAEEIFIVGRDEGQNLSIDHGLVEYKGPSTLQRHHHMFVGCRINKLCIGGPAINFQGQIVGMVSLPQVAFIPSSIILKCLQMWKKFRCIPRLHVGMKFSAIGLLDPARIEKISRKCDVDSGLIVTQVSNESVAEKFGVRNGDIIQSWNGENILTTIELENFLLHMGEKHLDKGNSIGSSVDLSIGIFHIRKDSRRTIKLTVNVSDDVEVVAKGTYDVTPRDCTLVDDDDDVVQGEESTHETAADEVGDREISTFSEHGITGVCEVEVYGK